MKKGQTKDKTEMGANNAELSSGQWENLNRSLNSKITHSTIERMLFYIKRSQCQWIPTKPFSKTKLNNDTAVGVCVGIV